MAVTLTADQLRAALRLGDSAQETQEATRLLDYARMAVEKRAPDAPGAVQNEAVIRLSAYLYDRPFAPSGDGWANALRNSGAGAILGVYFRPRARSTKGS